MKRALSFTNKQGLAIEQGSSYHISLNGTVAASVGAGVDTRSLPTAGGVGVRRASGRAFWAKSINV